jgi:hypothetical protein
MYVADSFLSRDGKVEGLSRAGCTEGANRTTCVHHVMAYECCKHVKSGDRDGGLRLSVLAHADVRRWSA